MTNIKFDISSLKKYLSTNNIIVSNDDLTKLNSIFSQCDTISENGEQSPDGKLTGDEVPTFQRMIAENLSKISIYLRGFINSLAGVKTQNSQNIQQAPQVQQVECHRTHKELEIYNQKLNEAKNILLENANNLGLSEDETNYIKNITTESIDYGAGRYDEDSDKVIFNTNDKNQPNVANFVKIIMHEVTHGIRKNEPHTQAQELACERRGIEIARKLYDQGIIDNFIIYGDENRFADIESLDSTEKTEDFLNYWVKTRYGRLKEK